MRGQLARHSSLVKILVLGGASTLLACGNSKEDTTTPASDTGDKVVLAARSEVVAKAVTDVTTVEAGRLVFPASYAAALGKKPGDILIGDRQGKGTSGKNPVGFLRKVKSVTQSGNTIVVETDLATLPEAVTKLSFQGTLQSPQLTESGPVLESTGGIDTSIYRPQGGGKTIQIVNFAGKEIFNYNESVTLDTTPPKQIGFNAFAKFTKGSLNFTPTFDVGADIDSDLGSILNGQIPQPKLKSLHASATGKFEAEIELDAGIKLTTDLDAESFTKLVAKEIFKSDSATIADYDFDLGSLSVGPLPLPASAHFKAVLDCDLAWGGGVEVVVGGKASATITAGFKYENNQFSPTFEKSGDVSETGPTWTLDGVTRVKCSVTPTFQLNLFDMAVAEVWAKGYVNLGGSLTCGAPVGMPPVQQATFAGDAAAGVRAGLHAKVDVFGLIKYEKTCTLFDLEAPKGSFTKTFPLPSGQNASCAATDATPTPDEPPAPEKCFGAGDSSGAGGSGSGGGSGLGGSGGAGGSNQCNHDECTTGDPLGTECNECAKQVCAHDPYCCDEYWGYSCFDSVKKYCGKTCPN
jgi:bifunctional DNA-binding transcriptional regulator/antitoxin component of YhaV-PrlF toxin-antitoxin module